MAKKEEKEFNFWMEFFVEGIKEEPGQPTRIPVLVMDPDLKKLLPSHLAIHGSDDQSDASIELWYLFPPKAEAIHSWKFPVSTIRNIA